MGSLKRQQQDRTDETTTTNKRQAMEDLSVSGVSLAPSTCPTSPRHSNSGPPSIKDEKILKTVFTHASVSSGSDSNGQSYDSLEFIGDAYIELVATRLIHVCYPNLSVRTKSTVREQLVCNDSLSRLAIRYGFDRKIGYVRDNVANMSDKAWTKILADVFEAYVAGVMEDDPTHGFGRIEAWLHPIFIDLIEANPVDQPVNGSVESRIVGKAGSVRSTDPTNSLATFDKPSTPINPPAQRSALEVVISEVQRESDIATAKSTLNGKLIYPPAGATVTYRETSPAQERRLTNDRLFSIGVFLTGWGHCDLQIGHGMGTSKARAGNEAAYDALTRNANLIVEANKARAEFEVRRKHPYFGL